MTHKHIQEGKALWLILLLLMVAAGVVYYFIFLEREEIPDLAVPPPVPVKVEREEAEPQPQPETEEEVAPPPADIEEEVVEVAAPLPELAESDEEALAAAAEVLGEDPARTYLVTEGLISKLVATIDALTRDELPGNIIPVRGPGGEMLVTSDGESDQVNPETGLPEPYYIFDPLNFQRYTPQVEVLEAIDGATLVKNYRHYYPLLQQSYRELGYAEGEFNDRMLEVIDELLATPDPGQPVRLIRPEAFYEFADPGLEALSAGQKLMIRAGPSNAARIKVKLAEFRDAIQTQRE